MDKSKVPSLAILVAEHSKKRGAGIGDDGPPPEAHDDPCLDIAKNLRVALAAHDDEGIAEAIKALVRYVQKEDVDQDKAMMGDEDQEG